MTERVIRGILGGLLLAAVFILGVNKVADYDAGTHLALGREIVQHWGFPATEQFNFPSLDKPFYDPEWLFDVVFYLSYLAAGFAGVILLKASIVTTAFLVLFKDSMLPEDQPSHRVLGVLAATVILTLTLVMVRHRFVERPDIALMVFLPFTIYALDAYVYEGKRYLYFLPAVQLLWVNMHPSIVVGVVPFGAFLFGGGLQLLLRERFGLDIPGTPSKRQLWTIAAVLAGVLAASLLNPYGIEVFLAPFRFAASTWYRDEILELQPPTLSDLYGAPFIVTALLILIFVVNIRRLSIISVLLVAPFIYLGLSSFRFVFLLGFVSAPILARYLRSFAGWLRAEWVNRLSFPAEVFAASLIIAVTGLYLAQVERFADPLKIPGFGINYLPFPEGALRYLDRAGVRGKIYNVFKWGGYIDWRDYPRRMPIVDGRGNVPAGLLDEIKAARAFPDSMDSLQKKYGFDVAVVDYPEGTEVYGEDVPDRDLALSSRNWALVYWDDLSLVYLRRTDTLAQIIKRDEYLYIRPANGPLDLKRRLRDKGLFAPIEAELRRNAASTRSLTAYTLLGVLYNQAGAYDKAIEMLRRVRHFPFHNLEPNAYWELALAYDRIGKPEAAISYYKKAAQLSGNPGVLSALGAALEEIGNHREAIRYLELALTKDRNLIWAYPPLLIAYEKTGKTDRLETVKTAYRQALAQRQANNHCMRGLKVYLEGKLDGASIEFQECLKLDPRNLMALVNLGYIYYDQGNLNEALLKQTEALKIDRNYANAHYALALIYRDRGERADARKHFEEYLRLEPHGYWSRQAREQIAALAKR